MPNLSIRQARIADLNTIESIYDNARCFMRQTGNMHQWVNGYPSRAIITADLDAGHLFVCEEDSTILGVFCFFIGCDPTYERIYDGAWLREGESGVIHRIAVAEQGKGTIDVCINECFHRRPNLRIDTHRDNLPMQRMLARNGLTHCGEITLLSGAKRNAYEKMI